MTIRRIVSDWQASAQTEPLGANELVWDKRVQHNNRGDGGGCKEDFEPVLEMKIFCNLLLVYFTGIYFVLILLSRQLIQRRNDNAC